MDDVFCYKGPDVETKTGTLHQVDCQSLDQNLVQSVALYNFLLLIVVQCDDIFKSDPRSFCEYVHAPQLNLFSNRT